MKRTEIHEVYYGDHSDAQVKDAMNAAILSAVGVAVPKAAAPAPSTPTQRRTAPSVPASRHQDPMAAREPHKRPSAVSRRVGEGGAAEDVIGLDLKPVRDIATRELRHEEQSFVWREPVTAEEWLNGADGQYRSGYRREQ